MHQHAETDNPEIQKTTQSSLGPSHLSTRQATPADTDCLAQCNIAMALETEQLILPENTVKRGVRHMIAHPELGFYLLAEADTKIVGSLMLTSEWSDWRNGLFWWIQSVYVLPRYRHQGVYRMLYQRVKELALQRNDICGFRLYVEQENKPAQACYQALGMEPTRYFLYEETVPK
ncbi:MAG TPA: GNAT family N-acetyltransferase [Gammaproteobacteria bacterium]|nr:GNAT family N-acetyltransferase [Gammaproteobacteria bacterium]